MKNNLQQAKGFLHSSHKMEQTPPPPIKTPVPKQVPPPPVRRQVPPPPVPKPKT